MLSISTHLSKNGLYLYKGVFFFNFFTQMVAFPTLGTSQSISEVIDHWHMESILIPEESLAVFPVGVYEGNIVY